MGRDKAALPYEGRTQLERAMALLEPHVERAFVSVRAISRLIRCAPAFPQIADLRDDLGPIAGILAAQAQHPQAAWLVLACDLPLLDAGTLEHLLARARPGGTGDGLPLQPRRPAGTAVRHL